MTILVNMYNFLRFSNSRFNPQPVGGGGNWPTANCSGKILENKVQLRGPVGSIEGQRLAQDPMGVSSSVPRVPWYDFCCLEYKNIAHTANFLLWAIWPPPG